MVVDTSQLTNITLHKAEGYAILQGGARQNQTVQALRAEGMLALTGAWYSVGLAGISLGGGWGWFSKSRGFACDNVLSYTVATPGGTVVADADGGYSDLFWALRGGGHNSYGIVTSIKYRVYEPKTLVYGAIVFPGVADTSSGGPHRAASALHYWQQNYLNQPPLTLSLFPFIGECVPSSVDVLRVRVRVTVWGWVGVPLLQ